MNAKDALQEIKKLLFTESEQKFALTEGKLVDGTIVNYDYATGEIYVVGSDGVSVPAPVGEHQLETGEILVVTQEGIIAQVKEAETPQAEAEGEPMAADPVVDPSADPSADPKKDAPAKDEAMAKVEEAVASLSERLAKIEEKVLSMSKVSQSMNEAVKLSAQVLESIATQSSADPIQKPNTFHKNLKIEKDKRFSELQQAFQNLKTK